MKMTSNDALLLVDLQNDFFEGGALGVTGSMEIIAPVNQLIEKAKEAQSHIVMSRDWHTTGHVSFAPAGPWPPHCVRWTAGAEFHPNIKQPSVYTCVNKAHRQDKDAYSIFEDNNLADMLKNAQIERVFICGLATDYCVLSTVQDAVKYFKVVVIEDACCGITPKTTQEAFEHMRGLGALIVSSKNID